MFYVESNSSNPYYQLALEEYIFTHLDPSAEYCLLWQSRNTLYVARNQNTAEEIDQAFVDSAGVRVARRLSGGDAVYLDDDNLAFTYIAGRNTDPDSIRTRFSEAVVQTLTELDIPVEESDGILTIQGKRFSDSARFISHGRMIYHGYVRLDSDPRKLLKALQKKSRTENPVLFPTTSVNAHAPHRITYQTFKTILKRHLFDKHTEAYTLTASDKEAVLTLLDEKYETWEWNYTIPSVSR